MASSIAGSVMGCFLRGRLKEHVYAVPARTIEDLMERHQRAVITVDAKMIRHVRENSWRRTAVCIEVDRGRFENVL
jgi:hypothetical protein